MSNPLRYPIRINNHDHDETSAWLRWRGLFFERTAVCVRIFRPAPIVRHPRHFGVEPLYFLKRIHNCTRRTGGAFS